MTGSGGGSEGGGEGRGSWGVHLGQISSTRIRSGPRVALVETLLASTGITAREHGSNKKLAAQSCALSLVRQLYHLGVIEAYSGVTKKKEGETVGGALRRCLLHPEAFLSHSCLLCPAGGFRGQRGSRPAAAAGLCGPGAGSPHPAACKPYKLTPDQPVAGCDG